MSDSEERSATVNVSNSSEDLSTTLEEGQSLSSVDTYESSSKDLSTIQEGSPCSVDTCESSAKVLRDDIFVCNFRPAKYLKAAIDVLSNLEASSKLSGRIDVDNNGFNITVQNLSVLGHLHLNKACLFQCTKPLYGKIFSFFELCLELAVVHDEGTVHLSNCSGTDRLDICVLLGRATKSFSVPMSYDSPEICKFPEMSLFFTASVPSVNFRLMTGHLLQQKAPTVSVVIKDNSATLRAGNDNNPWTGTYAMLRADGSSAMEEGKIYSARFEWTNANIAASLQRASKLETEFVVLFHAERRPKSIILRFYLKDAGYLEFMKYC